MRKLTFLVATLSLCVFAQNARAEDDAYSFKLTNTTKEKMVKLEVSGDGKTWHPFNIGKGIESGEEATLIWNESSDALPCQEKVRAGYADGSESAPADFNFCEKDLHLEF